MCSGPNCTGGHLLQRWRFWTQEVDSDHDWTTGRLLGCVGAGTLTVNVFQIDSEDLPQEIIKVFGEAASQASLISIDEAPYGYEWRFEYLARRSWLEIAYDQWFLNGHIEEELYFMSKDGFLYYLPGFLVGSLVYRHTSWQCAADLY